MATRKHWMTEIAESVRERAMDAVDAVAAGIRDSVPFGTPPPPAPKLGLQQYLAAPPELRQAMLQGLPPGEFGDTMTRLQNEAVTKFGAMASVIMPMLSFEEAQGNIQIMQQDDPLAGVVAAEAELADILGMDAPLGF